jgi:hypothetical protein
MIVVVYFFPLCKVLAPGPLSPGAAAPSFVEVKFVHGEDVCKVMLQLNETIESFTQKLKSLYGESAVAKYEDEEGDLVKILFTKNVQDVIGLAQRKKDGLVRLMIASATAATPAPSWPLAAPTHSNSSPKNPSGPKTLSNSNFKLNYSQIPAPELQHKVFENLYALVEWECAQRNIDMKTEGMAFFHVHIFPLFDVTLVFLPLLFFYVIFPFSRYSTESTRGGISKQSRTFD